MELLPKGTLLVVSVALPELLSVPGPSGTLPAKNITVPVGVPLPGALAVTVAVKVMLWPKTTVAADDLTVTVVGSSFTFWANGVDVVERKLLFPEYLTVIELPPAPSANAVVV